MVQEEVMLDVLLQILCIIALIFFIALAIITMYEVIMMQIEDLRFWAKLRRIKEKNGRK